MKTDTTYIKPEWHILESLKGYKIYSKGLRCYGTYDSIKLAYNAIVSRFPHKRGRILVHNINGTIKETLFFSLKVI